MKYKNYLNTKNGSNRIYSTDNLLQMTMNDILDAEDALGYQYNTIGLPDDSDLFNSSFVRQTRTPKGILEWQSILDDGIAPQTNIVNHIVDPQISNLKTPPFVPQYKQVMNTTPQNFFSTQKSTYELLEEERERQRQQQLQQQQRSRNLGNTPVQTPTSSMPMEEIAPVDLGGTSIDMNLVGDLVNTAVNKYKIWKKKPESKSVLKDAIDTEVNNKPLKQTDLQEAIKTSTTPDVEDPKTTSSIGNAIEEATTLRNDPLWDELTKSLPNATPEGELTPEEQFQLEQFNKAWDKKNGVKPVDGVPTGGAAGVNNRKISDLMLGAYNDYRSINNPLDAIMYSLGAFTSNYYQMKDADTIGADKYFHAKANYDSAQYGAVSEMMAKIISDIREWSDHYRNIYQKGYSNEYSKKDIEEDQKANETGRRYGRMYFQKPASEVLKPLMPKGLPDRYRK